jgi:ribosome-associated protein
VETFEKPSKSALKREMTELQVLGAELVGLSRDQLRKLDLPEPLLEAVRDAQRFTQHGAHRRQLQFIGKLMRTLDPVPIRAALDEIKGLSAAATARMHAVEHLRTCFLEDERVITEIAADYPQADLQHLRQLRRNALKEQQQAKPPRAFRELYRVLRELQSAGETPNAPAEEGAADE